MNLAISRRSFLKLTGLTLAVSVTPFGYDLVNASEKQESFKPNVWIEITPDNTITISVGISEMGQGTSTALPMIVADELEQTGSRSGLCKALLPTNSSTPFCLVR